MIADVRMGVLLAHMWVSSGWCVLLIGVDILISNITWQLEHRLRLQGMRACRGLGGGGALAVTLHHRARVWVPQQTASRYRVEPAGVGGKAQGGCGSHPGEEQQQQETSDVK